jgi:glycosyltransferase involved in cell wall biosynthesis
VGWYIHEVMRRMVLRHPDDQFFFLFDRPFDPQFVYAPNVTPLVLFPPARHPILFRIWFEWAVPRALRRHGAELFFSPDSLCSLRSKVPTVMTCHDLAPLHHPEQLKPAHRNYYPKMLPRFLRRADHILTVSDYVRQDIAQTCGIPLDKITTVHNGCRDIFQPLQDLEKQKVREKYADAAPFFFYTGAIHPRKNIPRLLRAFDRFKDSSGAAAKLLLAGRFGWETGPVTEAYEQARHRADIRFLGYLEDGELARLMASAQALCYLSTNEGFGLPMVEAMRCGTPVLAANASCLPEIAGDAALLVDPLSEEAIAAGLAKLHSDTAFAAQLVEKGQRQAQHFSWDRAADAIYEVLRSQFFLKHEATKSQS